jgi:hypothetical protein
VILLKPNKEYQHVYGIIRVDQFRGLVEPEKLPLTITVKKIVREYETAKAEVERLNKLNSDKGCIYFWQVTRLAPE